MALSDLLEALRRQAAEHRADELAQADTEVARIREESRAEKSHRRAEYVEAARREAEDAARRAVARAESDAARSVLAARDRLLGRVREALDGRIETVADDPAYVSSLAAQLREALDRLPTGPLLVRASVELVDAVRELVGRRSDVVVEVATAHDTGFSVVSAEGAIEVDGTLATMLDHAWPALAVDVLREVGR
jgi:vacuolar-type H+-ATPase subunit E/Vma4